MPPAKRPLAPDSDYTPDPDVRESDRTFGRAPIYAEEAGVRASKVSTVTLAPCQACGVPVIVGRLDSGALMMVEPQVLTYALLWASGETYPRLTPGRGYPAHRCKR